MYVDYWREKDTATVIEKDYGFAVVVPDSPEVLYLKEIYIKPEFRKSGKGRELLTEVESIAKEAGMTHVLGSVCTGISGDTDSLKAQLACGFRLLKSDNYMIFLIKEIEQ